MKCFKRPESVLVVIHDPAFGHVLMLKRNDDPTFWQSVTGTIELGETPRQAAVRELHEELGLAASAVETALYDCKKTIKFKILPQFLHRYAPNSLYCQEHWFTLSLSENTELALTEHSAYQWMTPQKAMALTPSWNNALAIEQYILR